MENEIKKYIEVVKKMIADGQFQDKEYEEIENFILKNGSRLGNNMEFNSLSEIMDEAAAKFGKRNIRERQENFGLNSCAQ